MPHGGFGGSVEVLVSRVACRKIEGGRYADGGYGGGVIMVAFSMNYMVLHNIAY